VGKVYIDPEISKCKVPNDTRGTSKGSAPLAKGSRISINENANVVRSFIWWTNEKNGGRVDIDLHAAMLDKDLSLVSNISFYNLKNDIGCHSGDITNAGDFEGEGVAEFVDVDISKAKEEYPDVKYIAFTVYSYTGQTYNDLEHVHFGIMEREKVNDGQIFEPSTVKHVIKPSAQSTRAIMCAYDVETREMIWIDDLSNGDFTRFEPNTLHTNLKGVTMNTYKAIHMEKPNIDDVIRINVEARGGELVENREDADLVFALDGDIKPTDLDYFSGNLIPKNVSKEYEIVEEIAEEIENIVDENAIEEQNVEDITVENLSEDENR
jgi:stress response protein SCP2